jgi:hypothetical protein
MTDPGAEPGLRPPRLVAAILGAPRLAVEHAFALLVANTLLGLIVAAYVVLLVGVPAAIIAIPLLALPTAALTRLAVAAVRLGVPTLAMARNELGRLPLRKIVLALVQVLVLGISLTNIGLAGEIGGLAGLMSGGVAIYALLGTAIYAMALWPIVCDPRREGPLREQRRLALVVTVRRPLQLATLALIAGLAAIASVQVLVLVFFLPILVVVAIAGYVVPAADEAVPPRS